ncbi:MAG: OFA family MFS transporter [Pelovirga sp.]
MAICPYFDQDKKFCDVGEDYISPYDVVAMSHFCSSRYRECEKFPSLTERYPEVLDEMQCNEPVVPTVTESLPKTEKTPVAAQKISAPLTIKFGNKWPLFHRLNRVMSVQPSNLLMQEEREVMQSDTIRNRGLQVVFAGLGINLALGILYAYSMLKGEISKLFAGSGDPYATACLAFAFSMILGGKMQDKVGPRVTAILGGLLVGAGFIVCSMTSSYWGWIFGFGVLAGLGIGFGYSAATPPALKWFSPAKTGLIAGIVVSGFGIAPVYLAPLSQYLLGQYGLHSTMMILGIAFIISVCGMSMLLSNPPAAFSVTPGSPSANTTTAVQATPSVEVGPLQMLKEGRFYTLWLTFFIGAGAGLMVIGSIAGIAKQSMGELAFIAVAVMAIGNAAGRIVAGILSDKIGRASTLTLMLAFQAILMFAAIPVVSGAGSGALLVTLLATFIGFNYGSNLSLFPSFAKDFWGAKNYGMNYGILFSSWGIGAFVLVKASAILNAKYGGMQSSFMVAGVLLLVGAMMAMSLRPQKAAAPATAPVFAEEEDLVLEKVRD